MTENLSISGPDVSGELNDSKETSDNSQKHISVDAIRRIGRDVKDIMKEPHENIIYIHSTTNVNKGYAMVVGTCDTPYFCVPMFYSIEFPSDYPHSPPKMKFLTHSSPNGKSVRMHPNYYVNGKCCLSLLNSWSGEKWTGCQTLRSLLMTILMTLTDNPLTNEPGFANTSTNTHGAYRAAVTEAGLSWIAKFISVNHHGKLVRFCKDDVENAEIEERFRSEFVNKFIKRIDYGIAVLKMLREYQPEALSTSDKKTSNTYNRFINGYDGTTHHISCYRSDYSIDFVKTKNDAMYAISVLLIG